jgi:hypothetical protein
MKPLRYILIGFLAGMAFDMLWWFCGPYSWDSWVLKFLTVISTPVALIISKITGEPLMQESALMIYTYAIVITLPLLGIIIGSLIWKWKKIKNL